jgi:hypothetical protein
MMAFISVSVEVRISHEEKLIIGVKDNTQKINPNMSEPALIPIEK